MFNLILPERAAAFRLIALALEEDLGHDGDITSQATIPLELRGNAEFVARSPGVLAGLCIARDVFFTIDPSVSFRPEFADGAKLKPGDVVARISGSMRSILKGERTSLNFVQHLSGIATLTNRYVEAIAGTSARILDTRKTLPGWRRLEKYAVRCGGGLNHRIGLYDGILIKDNHLAALGQAIPEAIAAARKGSPRVPLEIEVDSLEQFDLAMTCQPDMILLDNMSPEMMSEAVRRRDERDINVQLEASGGINLTTVLSIAQTGVDRISVGALTHSAPALDLALDYR